MTDTPSTEPGPQGKDEHVMWHVLGSLIWRRFRNPVMLLIMVGLLWVLAGIRGINLNALGAPFLFWHEDWVIQLVSLIWLGFFIEEWVYVAFLLDTDPANPNPSTLYFQEVEDKRLKTKSELIQAARVNTLACCILLCLAFSLAAVVFRMQVDLPNSVRPFWVFCQLFLGVWFGLVIRMLLMDVILPKLSPKAIDYIDEQILRVDDLEAQITTLGAAKTNREIAEQHQKSIANMYASLADFHRMAALKQLAVVAGGLLLCFLHWLPWTKPVFDQFRIFQSVAAYASILLTFFVGFYGFLIFHRRRPWYERFVSVIVLLVVASISLSMVLGRSLHLSDPIRGLDAVADGTDFKQIPSAEALSKLAEVAAQQQSLVSAGSSPYQISVEAAAGTLTDRPALNAWKNRLAPYWKNGKPPLVVVANSGGGIKAQVWSTVALTAIEHTLEAEPNGQRFANHVRLVTGTSGGMVGACYWVATVPPRDEGDTWSQSPASSAAQHWSYQAADPDRSAAHPLPREVMVETMSKNALSRVARHMFFDDFVRFPISALLGFATQRRPFHGRGVSLETTWEQFTAVPETPSIQPMGQPFRDLAEGEMQGWRPSLALAPCVAEDGRRLLISNLPIEYILLSDLGKKYQHPTAGRDGEENDGEENPDDTVSPPSFLSSKRWSVAGYSARLLNPNHQMRVSTAARLSANFPVIVDSPSIPNLTEGFRVMDAGYIDNYGLMVAARWLQFNSQWLRENTSGVLFIQLSSSHLERQDALAKSASAVPEVGGFIGASFNKTLHHQDMAISQVARALKMTSTEPVDDFFQFISLEYEGPASLSWYLTSAEKYSLLYPFMEAKPDAFKSELFSDQFQQRVLTDGQATFDETEAASVERLRGSRGTIKAELQTISEWWKRRVARQQPNAR